MKKGIVERAKKAKNEDDAKEIRNDVDRFEWISIKTTRRVNRILKSIEPR